MDTFVKLLVVAAIMGVLDFVWLGYLSKKLYQSEIGSLLLKKPNMGAAILFYVIYVIGVVVFVVNPALANESLAYAAGYGALFGFVAYATYDLTNLAVIRGFTKKIVAIDLAWGALLTAVVASGAYIVLSWWF